MKQDGNNYKKQVFLMKRIFSLILFMAVLVPAMGQQDHNFEVAKNLDIFNAFYKELDLYYVDTLDAQKLVHAAIDGMLNELDPYTEYYSEKSREDLKQMTTGKYAGIGAIIQYNKKTDRCVIGDPFDDNPAAKAGLRAGDVILSIDGKDIGPRGSRDAADYSQSVSEALRGEPGSSFEISVQRPGVPEPLTLTIVREMVAVPAITFYGMADSLTGYILLSEYTEDCARYVRRAIVDLKQQGMERLVLDLRGNGGGLMSEAVSLVNLFIPKGKEVLHTKGKISEMNQVYKTTEDPLDLDLPLVVLVNGSTASSAEITSGALQDYDRAVILGSRTYGKGLVQQPRDLPYGTQMKLTTSKYYIPSGRCVQAYDFQHRNADGSPRHLPDSLCSEFRTVAGRVVRDGGGITPDVVQPADTMSALAAYLLYSDELFDFCNAYRNAHDSIPAPDFYELPDAVFDSLKVYLSRVGFTYDRETKRLFAALERAARLEGTADSARSEFAALRAKLSPNLSVDLDRHRDEVSRLVSTELIRRYYYAAGVARYAMRHDELVARAVRLLDSPEEMRRLLGRTGE